MSDAGIASFVKSSEGRVSGEEGVKLAQNSRQQIVEATAESLVTQAIKNPSFNTGMAAQLEKQLNDPIFTDNLDPKKRAQLLGVIAGAHGTQEVAESQIFKSRLPDMLEQAKLTGDTRQIDAGIQMLQEKTPEETIVAKQEAADKRNEALAFYTVSHDAGAVPRDQEAAYLAQRQTDLRFAMPENVGAATAAHKAAQQFFAERDKAFVSGNQASFLIAHNETVNAYKQTFDQNPTAANFDRYASYSSALQRHLYPGVAPRVLTPEMTSGIATAMHAINESGTGAAVAAKTLSDAANLTGHFWPGISRELLEKKVINGDQFTAALLFSDPRAASLAPALLSASAMTARQRAELHGVPEQKIEPFAAKAFDGFNKTLANIPEAAEVMSAHATALTHLMQVQGLSTQADATALAK
ncbi:MAG: hypothetical protein KGJ13_12350, partial [Patescibacteria group bacterium]|nr:hypothetical protein [Patescibacteria group bacterium]